MKTRIKETTYGDGNKTFTPQIRLTNPTIFNVTLAIILLPFALILSIFTLGIIWIIYTEYLESLEYTNISKTFSNAEDAKKEIEYELNKINKEKELERLKAKGNKVKKVTYIKHP